MVAYFHGFAEKMNYYSEKFDAKLFLSRVHLDTTAGDLESGALSLKSDLKGRTQQKKQLVKENFDCFVSCKTTIDGQLGNIRDFFCVSYEVLICLRMLQILNQS